MTARPRVLVADPIADAGIAILEAETDVDVLTDLDHDGLLTAVPAYDAMVVRSATRVDAAVIAAADRLRVIGRAGVGIDNIDVEAATARGITVCNVPASNVVSAAEHTVAMLLALARRIPRADASLRAGRWDRAAFGGVELQDKTIGVVGFGRVGRLVAERCQAFGMRVVAHDPYVANDTMARAGCEPVTDLDDLLSRADVVTVHLPLTDETSGLIGEAELRVMRPHALLVNCARGGLVDEAALARALDGGWIAGAAVDVFATEPPGDSPLLALPERTVLTPHLGATTTEAQDRASRMVADAVLRTLRGELVPGAVNIAATAPLPDRFRGFPSLARRLGRLVTALRSDAGRADVVFEYVGGLADDAQATESVTLAGLVGLLTDVVDEPVTYVNVRDIAARHGVTVSTLLSPGSEQQPAVRISIGDIAVGGTLTEPGPKERLTEIWGFAIDVEPAEHMVFFRYEDRPGVIGTIGQRFGAAGVNIAGMQVARRAVGAEALMAMATDSQVPYEVLRDSAHAIGATDARTLPPSRYRVAT